MRLRDPTMTILLHLLLFFISAAMIWFLSGILIDAVDRVARRYNKPGFVIAFFILGFLTSISEMSVLANATLQGIPQMSAGNLIGASCVIFLLIIPLLAVVGGGIEMRLGLDKRHLGALLVIVLLPSIFTLDGDVRRSEGLALILLYGTFLFTLRTRDSVEEVIGETVQQVETALFHHKHKATAIDVLKIFLGASIIFFAGKLLVDEVLFFSSILSVAPSLMGLVVLSVGTNLPELVIALRSVIRKQKGIAFGDYLGSAAANTLLFGILALLNGRFVISIDEFLPTSAVLAVGLLSFFIFSRTKSNLSRKEGVVLLSLYGLFLAMELWKAMTG